MSDSSIIQQARDVLAKWRERATEGPWTVVDGEYSDDAGTYDGSQIEAEHEMVAMDHQDLDCGPVAPLGHADARLIVGTAGNPDLLDAIDGMLAIAAADIAEYGVKPPGLWNDVARVAAAIVAADGRMGA
ncbi:hypothetical protein [Curtobacterium sp. BRD11]|uniref:hypothetical protein n=1 Tax=Curtobacterium sp. BRD11 TaxID=2962581 RepID=UPI00288201F6|nr:hypothetical protein [Curtobacterium sp. BRD11]MDT0211226.1 hypothetical protein [Curtobacterium sp. BRD11]